ncbi:ABC transporter ATP-binding protein/permease [Alkaliphilus sp. MSJ-5]|uniref:ABC transporter ATP-binding protein/permease n=1 Tax=Alkaliphilus flagellatus TaxID=2841507 RepID=A0ABS6FYB0_9FIRM|nr:ABC transporter ATP-binding protein [Alkaliphilus flagellatus]MBU5675204.1 ABC transporter ATP-binding protein/permease [Alkaliphilus flagellatus]
MKKQSNLNYLLYLAGGEKKKLFLAVILSVISSILAFAPFLIIYKMIMILFEGNVVYKDIFNLAVLAAVIIIVRIIFFIASGAFSHVAAFNILYNIRMKIIKHMGNLNLGFFTNKTSGELKKVINEDIEKMENFLAHHIPDISAAVVAPFIMFIYLLYLNYKMALVLLIPVVIGGVIQSIMFKNFEKRMEHYFTLLENMNSTIVQFIQGISIMKAFNVSSLSFEKYRKSIEEYADYWKKITETNSQSHSIFLAIMDSGLLFTIPLGGYFYINGGIGLGTYLLFIIISMGFLNSFKALLELGSNFSMIFEGVNRIKNILDMPKQESGKYSLSKSGSYDIEIKNVSFKYEDKNVLNNVNTSLEKGTINAFVGASGAGKTTLAQLIGRFWDVNEGEILINNKNIKDISMENLMDSVAFVFQDIFMLNDTIYENIRMGNENVDYEEVTEAAKKAQIHDFIMTLPNGYETRMGESGIKLSGGEKQRISIARAILKDAPIILLDEATASLDADNEIEIQKSLQKLTEGKTVIVIAHKLNTIVNSDQIIVLNDGQIEEIGNHEKLLKNKKRYFNMYKEQEQAKGWVV